MVRYKTSFLLLLTIIFLTACGSAANKATPTPTEPPATNTPIPTPTATPTPEPVFSYYMNADDVNDLTVDEAGQVWAATNGGIIQWNLNSGDFSHFHRGSGLPQNAVYDIAYTSDGSIWAIAGGPTPLLRFRQGEWIAYSTEDNLLNHGPRVLHPTEGGLWIGCTYSVAYFDLDLETFTNYTKEDGLEGTGFGPFLIEPDGKVWVGSSTAVNWLEDGTWNSKFIGATYVDIGQLKGLVDDFEAKVLSITRAPDGSIWFGTEKGGARYANGTWSYFTSQQGIYLSKELWDIEFDARGTAWGVQHGSGLYHYQYGRWWWEEIPSVHYIHFIEPDPLGNLWFGTREYGVLYLDDPDITWYTVETSGLASDEIAAILPLEDGTTLVAHPDAGISRINREESTLRTYQVGGGVPSRTISEILTASDGTLWVDAMGLYTFDGTAWQDYANRNIPVLGKALSSVYSMLLGPDDTLWIGLYTSSYGDYRNDKLIAAWDGESWTTYTTEDGLFEGDCTALDFAPDGTLWALINKQFIGSDLTGVAWMQDGQWSTYTSEDGFPSEKPRDLVVDANVPSGSALVMSACCALTAPTGRF
ncbi:MAG: hypothetical protein JXA25_17100 [Anaerolineales bacterium]|nr:hypothetical protein [Anaerolineales bacterium]